MRHTLAAVRAFAIPIQSTLAVEDTSAGDLDVGACDRHKRAGPLLVGELGRAGECDRRALLELG
jgi:hypothetical protein